MWGFIIKFPLKDSNSLDNYVAFHSCVFVSCTTLLVCGLFPENDCMKVMWLLLVQTGNNS